MSIRAQILAIPESLSDLVWAAEQRFRDNEILLRHGQFSGAVYLLGLSSEMSLKVAAFRYSGGLPTTVAAALFGPVRSWMRANAPAIDPEAYHSLKFWAEYLIRVRTVRGPALSSSLAGELRHHVVRRLHDDWKIDLRYRALPISERHAIRVYNDTAWVRRKWNDLWR